MTKEHYKELSTQIDRFFEDEIYPVLVSRKADQFGELDEWLTDLYKSVIKLRSEEEDRYDDSLELLFEKAETLQGVIDRFFENNRYARWKTTIKQILTDLPEIVTVKQGEDRYRPLEEDGLIIRIRKSFKRLNRQLRKGEPGEQHVPLRQLAASNLLGASDTVQEIAAREFEEITLLLDFILEKTADNEREKNRNQSEKDSKDDDGKKGNKDLVTFRLDVIRRLKENLESARQNLKEYTEGSEDSLRMLLEPIKHELISDANKGGTFELSIDEVSSDKEIKFIRETDKVAEGWKKYVNSQLADLEIQLQLAGYGVTAAQTQEQILDKMHVLFRDLFYIPIENGIGHCHTFLNELDGDKEISNKKIEKYRKKINELLENDTVAPSGRVEGMAAIIDRVQRDVSHLQSATGKFTGKIELAAERERTHPLPIVKPDTINWRSLAARYLKDQAVNKLDPIAQQFPEFRVKVAAEIDEAANVVDINLAAASEYLSDKESDHDPKEIAMSGIKRAITILESAIKLAREKQDDYQQGLKTDLPRALQDLAVTMLQRDYDRFELEDKARMVKEQATDWRKKLTITWAKFSEQTELGWRFFMRKYKTLSNPVFRFLGFRREDQVSSRQMRSLAEYLARPGMDENLPFIYKRLFDRYFKIDQRFYERPIGSRAMFREAYGRWKKGLDSTVMIIGEKGSGKTTMMNLVIEDMDGDEQQIRLDFTNTFYKKEILVEKLAETLGIDKTDSIEELIESIGRLKKRRIFLVENLQNIFIRNIHGFDALKAFWEIVSATGDKLFWVVNCSRYSWAFITKMSDADQYFNLTIEVDRLEDTQVCDAILERHNATGYDLEFKASEAVKNSRAYKKLLDDEEKANQYVQDYFFKRLAKVSEGNMSIAMLFWLQSIKEFDDKRFVIAPLEIADVDKLEVPSREVLFALAAFVVHDTLNADEMAMALHQNQSESRLMIARLKAKGIIEPFEHGYQMNQLIYRQVVRLLKRKNIIH